MKEQVKKYDLKEGIEPEYRSMRWFRIMRVILSILLAVIICLSCTLLEIVVLKIQVLGRLNGSASDNDKIRIYIDQGHNPSPHHNNGAEGNGLYEQDVTFSIGCMLAEILEKDGRFEVRLSRPEESTVLGTDNVSSLAARVEGAADFEADYFISLHINAYTQESVNGLEVFASDNDVESYSFGGSLLQGMLGSTNLKNRGVKSGSELYVLKNATMPAVLLEMGFISNAEDAALLSQQPELFAEGIYDGIVDHFESAYSLDISILLWMLGISVSLVIAFEIAIFAKLKRLKNKK